METRSNHVLVGSVVLILIAVMLLFLVWIARIGTATDKEYDIFFKQSVDGLATGSAVTYSGVPLGQVKDIKLFKPDPQFVRVRIKVTADTPILEGTKAAVIASFTGTSTIQLDGAVKGNRPIACPEENAQNVCPFGVPVIPPKASGIGALLSSAPQLLERISTLTEKLSDLLSDKNQKSIAGILSNVDRLSSSLADRGPEIAQTLVETRETLKKAGIAAEQIGNLADTTNGVMARDFQPAAQNLNKTVIQAQKTLASIDGLIGDAKPGVQAFSKQTIPEVGQLVHDLREMSQALTSVAEKVDRGGATSLVGQPRLPDYKPGKAPKP